ncbi:Chaperone protein Skp [Bienertia sinuspersici]
MQTNERGGYYNIEDGWARLTKMLIMNFLVYSNRGTLFHKSVDATNIPSRNANCYLTLMRKVVDEVGSSRDIQVVTNNEAVSSFIYDSTWLVDNMKQFTNS